MEQKNILSVFYVVSAADMLDYILMEKMDLERSTRSLSSSGGKQNTALEKSRHTGLVIF